MLLLITPPERSMILKNLSLANCGGFEQLDISFEPDVTLIAGVNGAGKSTVLRALAVLLSRALPEFTPSRSTPLYFTDDNINGNKSSLEVSARIQIASRTIHLGIQRLRDADEAGDRFILLQQMHLDSIAEFTQALNARALIGEQETGIKKTRAALAELKNAANPPVAVYFSPKRQLPGQPRSLPEAKPFSQSIAYSHALHDREVELREFMHWFRTQEKLGTANELHRLKVLESLRSVVSEFVPEFGNLRVQEKPRLGFVVDKRGQPFYLHQLSDGERGLLALVFDLTRRLAIANPESDNPIAEGVALVLIDEIELHLHPKWQRDVIKRLPAIFKSCQFVITTHSPQVLGEIQARCVRLLSIKDGRVISETPGMAYGADSNWILNVLMGADEKNEEVEHDLAEIARLVSNRNLSEAKTKIADLRTRVGNTDSIQKLASIIERIERLGK